MTVIQKVPNYSKLDKEEKFAIFLQTHNLVRDKFNSLE